MEGAALVPAADLARSVSFVKDFSTRLPKVLVRSVAVLGSATSAFTTTKKTVLPVSNAQEIEKARAANVAKAGFTLPAGTLSKSAYLAIATSRERSMALVILLAAASAELATQGKSVTSRLQLLKKKNVNLHKIIVRITCMSVRLL